MARKSTTTPECVPSLGEYPRFTCPICAGEATLVDGDDGPEFLCLDCITFEPTGLVPAAQ